MAAASSPDHSTAVASSTAALPDTATTTQPSSTPTHPTGPTSHPSLHPFTLPPQDYFHSLSASLPPATPPPYTHIATGALVFHSPSSPSFTPSPPRVLLLRRSPHDFLPHRWEPPGGACDPTDPSILAACARELREESSLVAKYVSGVVDKGGRLFVTRSGRRVGKFEFVVEIHSRKRGGREGEEWKEEWDREENEWPEVRLDPNEHDAFMWATEQEYRAEKVVVQNGDGREEIEFTFTAKAQRESVLEGFRIWKEMCDQRFL